MSHTLARAQSFELLTPCFCAGADQDSPEMRIASIRGQLRWWFRILYGNGMAEYEVFGGIHGKKFHFPTEAVASRFKFALEKAENNRASEKRSMVPHKTQPGFQKSALPPGSRFTLQWSPQLHPDFNWKSPSATANEDETRDERLERAIRAWLLLGTVGRRATRAMGSVWPSSYLPGISDFRTAVDQLSLPNTVRVAVLNADSPKPPHSSNELIHIAGETVHGLAKYGTDKSGRPQGIVGDPLGFVDRSNRKSSPLRFKVGRFNDGLRLIAVWDNRDGRGGDLKAAILAIFASPNGQTLASWLQKSSL